MHLQPRPPQPKQEEKTASGGGGGATSGGTPQNRHAPSSFFLGTQQTNLEALSVTC